MRIEKIKKVKGHRIFRDFVWPTDLPDFSEKNLIYGWNGSGKSTLSNLFRAVEKRECILDGEVEFQIDGQTVNGRRISTTQNLPSVRVFNRDFVAANISPDFEKTTRHIFFLGEENVEKQKQVAELKSELAKLKKESQHLEASVRTQSASIEQFASDIAREIKEVMTALGATSYASYNKKNVKGKWSDFKKLSETDLLGKSLDEATLERFRRECKASPKPSIDEVRLPYPDFTEYQSRVVSILKRTVTAAAIERLKVDPKLGTWVKEGFETFQNASPGICPYCEQELSAEFLASLDAHFDDQFSRFVTEIDDYAREIKRRTEELRSVPLQDPSRLYDQLQTDYEMRCKVLLDERDSALTYLENLQRALEQKRERPFSGLECSIVPFAVQPSTLHNVNDSIQQHNQICKNFQRTVLNARHRVEDSYACKHFRSFETKERKLNQLSQQLQAAQSKVAKTNTGIQTLEGELASNLIPAKELTTDLKHYLGRDELTVEVEDAGYRICRHGITASHLSEGERTAVTFLFFLKSLKDKDLDITNSVIVVDDPVSSLDSNALFSAFGYLKERTKDAGQLFLLTHNFTLFRQIKNWYSHLNKYAKKSKPKPASYFLLSQEMRGGKRNACLENVDPLLLDFESEYHFLFKQIHDAVHGTPSGLSLSQYYGLPNVTRRLMETFLAHRFPDEKGELIHKFKRIQYDEGIKVRVLRFLNVYSHSGGITDPEHDLSALSEAKAVLSEVLRMIESVDSDHFDGMMKLLSDGQ